MQKREYKVTIGMPVFNVEKYIRNSLAHALEQDFEDIEILIVDDCGSDNSMTIVRDMQTSHPKGSCIRIFSHNENRGVAEARNTIIEQALGDYIFFLDSDDLVTPRSISCMYQAAIENKAEVVYGSMTIFDDEKEKYSVVLPSLVLKGEDALTNYIYSDVRKNIPGSSCNILIQKDFLHKHHLRYPNMRIGEDLMFNEELQPKVVSAVLLSDITYCYIRHANSLMKYHKRDVIDIQEVYNSLQYSEIQKKYCQALKDKPYYDGKCAKTMKGIFYSACSIIKHRCRLNGQVSDKEIRDSMKHPASLATILSFKHHKLPNLLFWLLGILPPSVSIAAIKVIGKKKGLIR